MDVDDVDDQPALRPKARCGRLRQKQRRLQIAAHQVVPMGLRDVAHRGRIEGGRAVDQNVEPPEFAQRGRDQYLGGPGLEQIRALRGGGPGAACVELVDQGSGVDGGAAIVNQHIRPASVQRAHDFRAHAPRAAGHQHGAPGEGKGRLLVRHAGERYRNVPQGCTRAAGG